MPAQRVAWAPAPAGVLWLPGSLPSHCGSQFKCGSLLLSAQKVCAQAFRSAHNCSRSHGRCATRGQHPQAARRGARAGAAAPAFAEQARQGSKRAVPLARVPVWAKQWRHRVQDRGKLIHHAEQSAAGPAPRRSRAACSLPCRPRRLRTALACRRFRQLACALHDIKVKARGATALPTALSLQAWLARHAAQCSGWTCIFMAARRSATSWLASCLAALRPAQQAGCRSWSSAPRSWGRCPGCLPCAAWPASDSSPAAPWCCPPTSAASRSCRACLSAGRTSTQRHVSRSP